MIIKRIGILAFFASTLVIDLCSSALVNKIAQEKDKQKQVGLLFSVFPDPTTTYPQVQQLDTAVSLLYDKTLGLPPAILSPIQRFYTYLKQRAISEQLMTIMVPSGKKQIPLPVALANAQEELEQAQFHNDSSEMSTLQKTINALTTQKNKAVLALGPQLPQLCTETTEWQHHLKLFLVNSFSYELQLLGTINQDEIRLFSYLPKLDTAYYTSSYQNVRNSSEYVRLFLTMTTLLRQRVQQQCTDWKSITDPAALYNEIEKFKKTDFFLFAQQFQTLTTQTTTTPLAHFTLTQTKEGSPSVPVGYSLYLTCTTDGTITVQPGYGPLFSIKNTIPALTALGSFLLTEQADTKTPDSYGLVQTPNYQKLFLENQEGYSHVPSPLYMELLSFNAINTLNQNISYLFNKENVASTMQALHSLETTKGTDLSSFPTLIFYKPEDQLFLEEINNLGTDATAVPSVGTVKPACHKILDIFARVVLDIVTVGAYEGIISADPAINAYVDEGLNLAEDAVVKVAGLVWNATKELAIGLYEDADQIYVETGLSFFVNGIIHNNMNTFFEGFEQAADFLINLPNNVVKLANNLTAQTMQLVKNVGAVAQEVVDLGASVLGTILAKVTQDPQLGSDFEGLVDSAAATVIGVIVDRTDMIIQYEEDVFVFTVEARTLIAQTIVGVVKAFATGNYMDILKPADTFLEDTVSSILGMVSLAGNFISDLLKNIMVSVAYLVATLTDVVDIAAENLAALGVLLATGSLSDAEAERDSVTTIMNEHRRLISAIITTVLMIIVTGATLGAAGPVAMGLMLALTVGMMVPDMIGANQQDLAAVTKSNTETTVVDAFKRYVNESEPAQLALQNSLISETNLRLQEQALNADRGLVYYQNYVNNALNSTQSNQAFQLSSFYSLLATPDTTNYPPNGLLPADPGYSYGIQTNRLDLNPSAGFRTYNTQRQTFAQEVSTLPAPLAPQNQSAAGFGTQTTSSNLQHFITQKDLCNFTGTQKTVTVRWRVIYESGGDFYVGIYLNQNYLDTNFLNFLHTNFENVTAGTAAPNQQAFKAAWQPLNTFNRYLYNFDYLAQAFVCYQNAETKNTPALGVYQHLSEQGFLSEKNQPANGPWFGRGIWYIMTATATDQGLTVSFKQEDDPHTVTWSATVPLTPLSQTDLIPYQSLITQVNNSSPVPYTPQQKFTGSFGIITSGAAVEYEILTPASPVKTSAQRASSNTSVASTINSIITTTQSPTELAREQVWYSQFQANLNPTFSNWKLQPVSELTSAQGWYIYTTNSTGTGQKDYVVSLTNPPGASALGTVGNPLLNSSAQLGLPITNNTSFMISLVTGTCYNQQGTTTVLYPDALAAYAAQNRQLPKNILNEIANAAALYVQQELKPVIFGNVTFAGVKTSIKEDIFIYACPSFTANLVGLDYFVFTNVTSNGPGTAQSLTLPAHNSINSAVSLVTGMVFNLVTGTAQTQIQALPVTTVKNPWQDISLLYANQKYSNTFSTYQSFLDAKTAATIQSQITSYKATLEKIELAALNPPPPPPPKITPPPGPPPPPTFPSGPPNFPSLLGNGQGQIPSVM